MSKSWKDYLLRSGMPLENDVVRYLDSVGCISSFEYSYLRQDENLHEKEFSYDVDSTYIKAGNFFELMIECKHRHDDTNWVFVPRSYRGPGELGPTDFLHPFSHFISRSFPFDLWHPETIGPACGKGVEITNSGDNEKSINQAVSQLAYAFAPKLVSAIEHQIEKLLVHDYIFFHVPIIVTSAKLRRLNEDIDIAAIRSAESLDEISTTESAIVMDYSIGDQLRNYNFSFLKNFFETRSQEDVEKMSTFTSDISHFVHAMSAHYAPRAVAVVHFSHETNGLAELMSYLDRISEPPEDLIQKIQAQDEERQRKFEEFEKRFGKKGDA